MKEWKKQKEYDGTNSYTLIFGHHLNKPKNILCLFRGEMTDEWYTTSSVLRTNWTWLASRTTTDDEAKLLVEEMIQEHYEDEIRYYQEILDEFKRGDKKIPSKRAEFLTKRMNLPVRRGDGMR